MCKQQDINLYATSEDVPVPLDEATMLKQMRKQMSQDIEYLLSEGLIDPKLFEKPIIGEDGTQKGINYYYSSLNMTSAHFNCVFEGWQSNNYVSAVYNGVDCFQFNCPNSSDKIYVAVTAFYPNLSNDYSFGGISPSLPSLSTSVSNYLNSSNTDSYYVGIWHLYKAVGIPQVQMALYSIQASKLISNATVTLVYQAIKQFNYGFTSPSALKYPVLELAITNTGTGGEYLHSLEVTGTGKSEYTNIASLITLGYKATKLAINAAVTGLTYGVFASIVENTLSFTKGTNGIYVTPRTAISNPAKNRYVYSDKTQSPLAIISEENFLQGTYFLDGNNINKTTKYKVTVSKANK